MQVHLSFSEFKKRLKRGNVVPVSCQFPADLETPVSVFLKTGHGKPQAFLLESVELGEKLGRFSFVGMDPEVVMEYKANQAIFYEQGRKRPSRYSGNFLEALEMRMGRYKIVPDPSLPPLVGGFVGYIGYELVRQFEDVTLKPKKGLPMADSVLFFPRTLIAFDHIKHQIQLIHLAISNGESPRTLYQKALKELARLEQKLNQKAAVRAGKESHSVPLKSNLTPRQFQAMVRKAKQYIRAGDVIQVVLSQRFDLGKIKNDFLVYRALRSLNPSPYLFYFRHKNLSLVGSSPEMLVKKTGAHAELRPIAGTRPRGRTEREDAAYEKALRASPKELAEHLMLVDLGRNDLGRVSKEKSVRVGQFARVERYSHVMHLVSDIQSVLKPKKTAFDLLRATFPAGTVTGAPKIRAMQIIDELEHEQRGPYAGSLGYFSLTGDMDMCITIRTIVIYGGRASVQAGAGIVNDSNPRKEYQETINKAKALLQAVRTREGIES